MNNVEKNLIIEILKYKTDNKKIEDIIKNNKINWMKILGFISYHRVAGLFNEKMNMINIRLLDYPVFFSIYMTNQAQKIRNEIQLNEIKKIANQFNANNIQYIFLKGTILNQTIFKPGARASNDIDILIKKESINEATNLLEKLGFVQGKYDYKKNIIKTCSEEEKNQSIILKGETYPFIKKSENIAIKTIDVDLNFSLDWNPEYNQELISNILNNRKKINLNDAQIYSANIYDNLIELCIHLYKDMALIDIVKKRKVFDLYKLIDIYYFVNYYFEEINFETFKLKINELNAEKYVYFAFKYLTSIFDDFNFDDIINLINILEKTLCSDKILNSVFDQYNKNISLYSNLDLKERIFKYEVIDVYK